MTESVEQVGGEALTACPICGYSLAGLPGEHRCPECGFAYDESMRVWMRSKAPTGLTNTFFLMAAFFLVSDVVTRLVEGSSFSLSNFAKPMLFAMGGVISHRYAARERYLVVGATGVVVCNFTSGPKWYPWEAVERVSFGFIHARNKDGKRQREPIYPGWNVRMEERRAFRQCLEHFGPPEKLDIDAQP